MNVTITKTEYQALKRDASAYRKLAASVYKKAIQDPIQSVVEDFRNTKLYNESFLKDLEEGLNKSSYGK